MRYTFIILGGVWTATVMASAHLDRPNHSGPSGINQRRQAPLLSPGDIPPPCVVVCAGASRDMAACGSAGASPQCVCNSLFLQVDLPPCVNCVATVNPAEQAPLQSAVDSIVRGCTSAGIAAQPIVVTPSTGPGIGNIPPVVPINSVGLPTGTTLSTASSTILPTSNPSIIGSSGGTVGAPGSVGVTGTLASSTSNAGSSTDPSSTLSIEPAADSTGIILPDSGSATIKASWTVAAVFAVVAGINAFL